MSVKKKSETGSLASLFQSQPSSQPIQSISSLFTQKIPSPIEEEELEPENEPYIDENASALVNKDRKERTIFVGNVDLQATKKEIKKFFTKYGSVEKIWERSLPVNNESKLPLKAKAITKDFSKTIPNPTKNCYVLFNEKEAAQKSLEANNEMFMNRHLRVDSCSKEKLENDYETTVFIGNLPYQVDEEALRQHFSSCGKIINVRLIRDSVTHIGKGFGYIRLDGKDAYKKALLLNDSVYENRQLRVRKALDPEKLEERAQQKQEKGEKTLTKRNAERRLKKKELKSLKSLKGFANRNTLEKNALEDTEFRNIITNNKSILKRKIKKGMSQSVRTSILTEAAAKITKKHDKNLFNGVDLLEKRRELRKKKAEINKKKLLTSRRT